MFFKGLQGRLTRLASAQATLDQQVQRMTELLLDLSRRLDEVSQRLEATDPHRDQP